jgi:hypothetical protein
MLRSHPPRVAGGLPAARVLTLADCLTASRLVDLHHEYPGETFIALDDSGPATGQMIAVASACLALGIMASKAVLFAQSAVPHASRLLGYMRTLDARRRGRTTYVTTTAGLGATCLAVRGTTIVAGEHELAAYRWARHVAVSLNAACHAHVLAPPVMRPTSTPAPDAARAVSPFEPRSRVEQQLLAYCANSRHRSGALDLADELSTLYLRLDGDGMGAECAAHLRGRGDYLPFVQALAGAIDERFAARRSRRDALLTRPHDLQDLLRDGAEVARREAETTLLLVEQSIAETLRCS